MSIPEMPFSDMRNKNILEILDSEIKRILIPEVVKDVDNTIHNSDSLLTLFNSILEMNTPILSFYLFKNKTLEQDLMETQIREHININRRLFFVAVLRKLSKLPPTPAVDAAFRVMHGNPALEFIYYEVFRMLNEQFNFDINLLLQPPGWLKEWYKGQKEKEEKK